MSGIKTGAVCYKLAGKNAGQKAVVIEIDEKTLTAVIDGDGMKKKKCNMRHLFFTGEKIDIKKGTKHEEIVEALK